MPKRNEILDEKQLEEDIKKSQEVPFPCTLCDEDTYGRGVFIADKKGTLGAPEETYRIVIYPICHKCSYKVGYKDEVKRKIFSEYN
jgi:hypothetical protein